MKQRFSWRLGFWLGALATLAVVAGCDHPFTPPEDPRSPVPPQSLPEKPAPTYFSHEEMMNVYDYLSTTSREARDRHAQIRQQKQAGNSEWNINWSKWLTFSDNQSRIIDLKRDSYKTARYQAAPGSPALCLSEALVQLDSLINSYGRNLSQDFPLEPDTEANFQAKLAQCKQLLDNYEPPEEFSGTPPPKIK